MNMKYKSFLQSTSTREIFSLKLVLLIRSVKTKNN